MGKNLIKNITVSAIYSSIKSTPGMLCHILYPACYAIFFIKCLPMNLNARESLYLEAKIHSFCGYIAYSVLWLHCIFAFILAVRLHIRIHLWLHCIFAFGFAATLHTRIHFSGYMQIRTVINYMPGRIIKQIYGFEKCK